MANEVVLNTIFQLKRGNAEAWTRNNPILRAAEPGYELDTGKLKIGDGTTAWNNLNYFGGNYEIAADGASIKLNDAQLLELVGFSAAGAGMVPRKSANGNLEWYMPTDVDIDEIVASEEFTTAIDTNVNELLIGTEDEAGLLDEYQKKTDEISVSRLINDPDTILIFNGGTA